MTSIIYCRMAWSTSKLNTRKYNNISLIPILNGAVTYYPYLFAVVITSFMDPHNYTKHNILIVSTLYIH